MKEIKNFLKTFYTKIASEVCADQHSERPLYLCDTDLDLGVTVEVVSGRGQSDVGSLPAAGRLLPRGTRQTAVAGTSLQQLLESQAEPASAEEVDEEVDGVVGVDEQGHHLVHQVVLSVFLQHVVIEDLLAEQMMHAGGQSQDQEDDSRADEHDSDGVFRAAPTTSLCSVQ